MCTSFAVGSVVGRIYYNEDGYEEAITFDDYRLASTSNDWVKWKAYLTQIGVASTALNLGFLTLDRLVHTVLPLSYAIAAENNEIFKKLIIR